MDGLGFALENYDGTGAWRDVDPTSNAPVDASAELPGGTRFEGPRGLREHLLAGGVFERGLLRHLMTFALGRALGEADEAELNELQQRLPADPTLRDLILGIIDLDAFRRRYREEP